MQVNLKKLLAKQELVAILQRIGGGMATYVVIEDADGLPLLSIGDGMVQSEYHRYPIALDDVTIGWVRGEPLSAELAPLLAYLVKQDAEKRGLATELLEKYQEIDLFYDISTKLTASLDFREIAQLVLQEVYNLVNATSGVILLRRENTDSLELLSQVGDDLGLPTVLNLGQGMIGGIVQAGREEIVNQIMMDPRQFEGDPAMQNLICVPLITKEQVMGAIVIASSTSTPYTAGDLKQLSIFASQTAVAIEKALLHQQTRAAAAEAQAQAQQLHAALVDLQHAQAQLIQSEKMSSLGQLVAGVAHEINNPVNFIYGNLSHASEYAQDLLSLLMHYQQVLPHATPEIQREVDAIDLEFLMEDLPRLLASMRVGADRILEIVKSLRNFSRLDEAEMKAVNIHEGIDSTLMILHSRTKPHGNYVGIQIIKHYSDLPVVECYPGQLNQVFMNILVNAIDALEESVILRSSSADGGDQGGEMPTITISTELMNSQPYGVGDSGQGAKNDGQLPDWVVIRIADNGPGMTDEVKQRLFDPFFTTKEIGKGTGLGMAISHQIIVERHGGILKCRSQPGEGAEFWIQIPIKAVSLNNRLPMERRSPAPAPAPIQVAQSVVSSSAVPIADLATVTDADGYIHAEPVDLPSQELLSRHADLIKRLTHPTSSKPALTPEHLYRLFQSHPILLKIYTTLLT